MGSPTIFKGSKTKFLTSGGALIEGELSPEAVASGAGASLSVSGGESTAGGFDPAQITLEGSTDSNDGSATITADSLDLDVSTSLNINNANIFINGGNVDIDTGDLAVAGNITTASINGQDPSDFVVGPASAMDDGVARFDGVTGKLIKSSTVALYQDPADSYFWYPNDNLVADANPAAGIGVYAQFKSAGTGDGGIIISAGGDSSGGNGGEWQGFGGFGNIGGFSRLNGGIGSVTGGDVVFRGGSGPTPGKVRVEFGDFQLDVGNINKKDDSANDANPAPTLIISGSNKTDGTGNGGNTLITSGTSVGGSQGRIELDGLQFTTDGFQYIVKTADNNVNDASIVSPILINGGAKGAGPGYAGSVTITGGYSADVGSEPGTIDIKGGPATNSNGGNAFFTGGNTDSSTLKGGDAYFRGGDGAGGGTSAGGDAYLTGGGATSGSGTGGVAFVRGGSSFSGSGGDVEISGGTGTTSGAVNVVGSHLNIFTVGKGINIKEGSNARMGVATLVAGTVTVSNTSVTTSTRVQLTHQNASGVIGVPYRGTVVANTSFVINSSSVADTSTILWELKEPL